MEILAVFLMSLFKLYESQSFELWNISLPLAGMDFAYGIFNDRFNIINGLGSINGNTTCSSVEYSLLLSPLSSNWEIIPIPIIPHSNNSNEILFYGGTTVQIGHLIYGINPFVGPNKNKLNWDSTLIFNLQTNEYINPSTYNSQPPQPLGVPCVVTDNHLIYSIGGALPWTNNGTNITLIYNISSNRWSYGSYLNIGRNDAGCSFDSTMNNIFLFGGNGVGAEYVHILRSIEKYNVGTEKWELLNISMPIPVAFFKCILYPVDENIYCIAGNNGITYMTEVQIFNPNDYSFKITHLNVARDNAGVVIYNDVCMLVFGGNNHTFPWTYLSSIETMNCNWTNNAKMAYTT